MKFVHSIALVLAVSASTNATVKKTTSAVTNVEKTAPADQAVTLPTQTVSKVAAEAEAPAEKAVETSSTKTTAETKVTDVKEGNVEKTKAVAVEELAADKNEKNSLIKNTKKVAAIAETTVKKVEEKSEDLPTVKVSETPEDPLMTAISSLFNSVPSMEIGDSPTPSTLGSPTTIDLSGLFNSMPTMQMSTIDVSSFFNSMPTVEMPTFDLSAIFPENLHDQLPQVHAPSMPQGMGGSLSSMMDQLFGNENMPAFVGDLSSIFSAPAGFFDNVSNNFRSASPMTITSVKVIHRPEYVAHECFEDAIKFCNDELISESTEHEMRWCILSHFNELASECQNILNTEPTLMEACYGEIVHFCPKDPTCKETMDCMLEHQKDIAMDKSSAKCLPFVNTLVSEMTGQAPEPVVIASNNAQHLAATDNSTETKNSSSNPLFFIGAIAGVIAFAVLSAFMAVLARQRMVNDREKHRDYEAVAPSVDEEEYDEYA